MRPPRFLLKPFPGEGNPAGLTIGGSIGRRGDTLSVLCEVRGNLSRVRIPAAAGAPRRRNRLWEETCVELFLAIDDSGAYWELNLSPSGHWNVYRFTGYREGMREEAAIASLPIDVRSDPGTLLLAAECGIGAIVPAHRGIAATVAAVIRTNDEGRSHWAPSHPAYRPDFHRRDGFGLILPATAPQRPGS